uniref:Uncharacterized protein n=1 Tax=Callithrix jacchus TaxID=9483 RepID=A0A8I3WGW8_CALJA
FLLLLFVLFCFFLEKRSLALLAQAGVQGRHFGSLPLGGGDLPGSSNSPALASSVAGITDIHYHAWLIFVLFIERGFCHVGQAGVELLTSGDPLSLAFQNAGITSVSHGARPKLLLLFDR